MKTIPKTSKRAAEVLAGATKCTVYTLENYFIGRECEIRYAAEALAQHRSAKLRQTGEGRYTVTVHGNLWYEIKAE